MKIDWRETRRRWKKLGYPGAFSSADYLNRALKKAGTAASAKLRTIGGTRRALQKSLLFQAHRDLQEHFPKLAEATTSPGEKWEADVGDFGRKIREGGGAGAAGYRFFLTVVDTFSRRVYGSGLPNKAGKTLTGALAAIIAEAVKGGELSGREAPLQLETDGGKEFINANMRALCQAKGIALRTAKGQNKARMAERAIRSLKRVIMASVQSGRWPRELTWDAKIKLACAGLNRRHNRGLGMSPEEGKRHYWTLMKRAWARKRLTPFPLWLREEKRLAKGEGVAGEELAPGDLVLLPRQKLRRSGIKDKEFEMHYQLMPYSVDRVFHGRKPCQYSVRHLRTKRPGKRLYYARELKKVALPAGVKRETLEDIRAVPGRGLEFKASDRRDWTPLP